MNLKRIIVISCIALFLIGGIITVLFEYFEYWEQTSRISFGEYLKQNVISLTKILIAAYALSLGGSFIRNWLGWIITTHILYFSIIYVTVTNALTEFWVIIIPAAIVATLLILVNSRAFYEVYNISKKNLLSFNLLAILISMISNLSLKGLYLTI